MYNFNKAIFILVFLSAIFTVACNKKDSQHLIRVGTIAGPETELMTVAKKIAEEKYGLKIDIITFNDYIMPNMALNEGSIDANVFQHKAYLDESIREHHFDLRAVGKTFVYPMAIYSKKIKNFSEIKQGAIVSIPNDPTNETRALLLLKNAHLITLKKNTSTDYTPYDIESNPYGLKIRELDAALLTRILEDSELSVINTNFAVPAGLLPSRDGLFSETSTSPYANLIVVRAEEADKPIFKQLEEALHSQEVQEKAKEIFQGAAIPSWDTTKKS